MITLTREEAQSVLDALEAALSDDQPYIVSCKQTVETLRARLAQPEPEPVAWRNKNESGLSFKQLRGDWQPLYTAPPQREWQSLTDEEIMSLLPGAVRLPPGWADTARAIEAKLQEKNSD